MTIVDRSKDIGDAIAANFNAFTLVQKIEQICTIVSTMALVFIPVMVTEAITRRPKPNQGRLKTIVNNQIYQQVYCIGGSTNGTIFMSKKGDALMIHTPPEITKEFLEDIKELGVPVKYIFASNEAHETHVGACKAAFPDAKLITPKPCVEALKACAPVDGTVEDHLEILERDFGFTKMFRADDNVHVGADRSFIVELYGDDDRLKGKNALFVAQCGYGNFHKFDFGLAPFGTLAGFNGGRYFRMFYWAFTKKHDAVNPYWKHMVQSVDDLNLAVFQHGHPIRGPDTKERLLKFYVY
mmetsp:Transcript_1095/g.1932  ORF Transcript_1095/g.1932 Transcript_1095/m.1932 type:complete len:297 (+) Transcript_1095:46-936(+)